MISTSFRYGLVARISRSHREGPGSIPGVGTFVFGNLFVIHAIVATTPPLGQRLLARARPQKSRFYRDLNPDRQIQSLEC